MGRSRTEPLRTIAAPAVPTSTRLTSLVARLGLGVVALALPAVLSACSSAPSGARSGINQLTAHAGSLSSGGGDDSLAWTGTSTGYTLSVKPIAGVEIDGEAYSKPMTFPGAVKGATVVLPANTSASTPVTYTFTLAATLGSNGTVASTTATITVSSVSYQVLAAAAYQFADPNGVALDGTGNVWVANNGATGGGSVTEVPAATPSQPVVFADTSTDTPFDGPVGLAADASGNVWVANNGGSPGWVTEIPASGARTPVVYANSSVYGQPYDVAVDGSGNVWVSDNANAVIELPANHAGNPISYSCSGCFNVPEGIAIDGSGNVWVANSGGTSGSVHEIPAVPAGATTLSGSAYGFDAPSGVAVDGSGNVWVTNEAANSLTEIPAADPGSPVVLAGSAYGFNAPVGVAVDGSGDVWVANSGGTSVTEIRAGAPKAPLVYSAAAFGFDAPTGIAVDGSGNVWVTNAHGGSAQAGSLTELVGAAAPLPFKLPLGK